MAALTPSETSIQNAVLEHWKALGVKNSLVACIPNAYSHGQAGLTKGLTDLVILAPGLPVGFLELKRNLKSTVSREQWDFADLCFKLGVPHALAYGRDEPISVLEEWGAVKKAGAAREREWNVTHPPVNLQIQAVARARDCAAVIALTEGMTPDERGELRDRLAAAVETLKSLEFGAAVAR